MEGSLAFGPGILCSNFGEEDENNCSFSMISEYIFEFQLICIMYRLPDLGAHTNKYKHVYLASTVTLQLGHPCRYLINRISKVWNQLS